MEIQDCFKGQRVRHLETGRVATVREVSLNKHLVDIVFDNGNSAKVAPRMLEASGDSPAAAEDAPREPLRPCPQCAAKMPVSAITCAACGFTYRTEPKRGIPAVVKLIVILILLAAIAFAVWKFVLHEQLPGS
jgi:hypothetical protein